MAVSSCGAGRASPLHGCRVVLEASYSIIQVDVSPRAARRLVEAERSPTLAYSTRSSRTVSPSRPHFFFPPRLLFGPNRNAEVDLISPGVGLRLDRESLPDLLRRRAFVELRPQAHLPGCDRDGLHLLSFLNCLRRPSHGETTPVVAR